MKASTAYRTNRQHNASSAPRSKAGHVETIDDYDWSVQDEARSARQIAMHARREQDRRQNGW